MKKIIAMMLALVMCFALVACGGSGDSADAGFKTAEKGKLYVALHKMSTENVKKIRNKGLEPYKMNIYTNMHEYSQ